MASRTATKMEAVLDYATSTVKEATIGVHGEYLYSSAVDLTADSTTVYTGACILAGIYVNAAISAHVTVIKDGTTTVLSLPASAAAGAMYTFPGIRFNTSLVCDPDDATTTGSLTFVYRPV